MHLLTKRLAQKMWFAVVSSGSLSEIVDVRRAAYFHEFSTTYVILRFIWKEKEQKDFP